MAGAHNRSNAGFTQVEPLLTVKLLKERFLFGLLFKDAAGVDLPDSAFQSYINSAVSLIEHDLDIAIMPRKILEEKDYNANDYFEWGYFQLNQIPIISVDKIQLTYLRTSSGEPQSAMDIPNEWHRVDKKGGIVRLIPSNRFPARLQVGSGGSFFPELFRQNSTVPQLWSIEYTHGFEEGKVPAIINQSIGYIASLMALSIGGNLVLGAGIAGSSLSLDGLSQSIQTTQSAENSAYSATRKEYIEQMFGRNQNDEFAIMKILRTYYRGANINIV